MDLVRGLTMLTVLLFNMLYSHSAPTSPQPDSTTGTTSTLLTTTQNIQEGTISRSMSASTPGIQPQNVQLLCDNDGKSVFAHPFHCALYYNCSHVYQSVPTFLAQYEQECPYPTLFSEETGKCEHYSSVKCGDRLEPKWECQYRKHWCVGPACGQPCESKYPSCIGKENGNIPFQSNVWLPYYKECQDERTMRITLCPRKSGQSIVFNPFSLKCEPEGKATAPKNYKKNICSPLVDGFYADIYGRCHKYFECKDRILKSWMDCQYGQVFDTSVQCCRKPSDVCGPCGQKTVDCDNNGVTQKLAL